MDRWISSSMMAHRSCGESHVSILSTTMAVLAR
uniref:Uncharacterized protein n=1 Tax=Arundo donax TaxID=35708 RepID=A0A0A9BA65_ARUDO